MRQLARQRIRYLVEFGGIYAHDEPATRNFVLKWLLIVTLLQSAIEYFLLH